jgi:hypothetical protein
MICHNDIMRKLTSAVVISIEDVPDGKTLWVTNEYGQIPWMWSVRNAVIAEVEDRIRTSYFDMLTAHLGYDKEK